MLQRTSRFAIVLTLTVLLLGLGRPLPVRTALAATVVSFVVDTTIDAVDANLADGKCASAMSSAAAGKCSLRAAIMEANAERFNPNPPAQFVVTLAAGQIYSLTIAGANEDEAASGDLDIRVPMTVGVNDGGIAVVQGGNGSGNWPDRIFDVRSDLLPGNVKLDGLRVIGGHAQANGAALALGGGIYVHGGPQPPGYSFGLENGEVIRSQADSGGGIYVEIDNLVLVHSKVSGNSATNGGGVLLNNAGPATFEDVTISENKAGTDGGGVFRQFGNGSMNLLNSTVTGNSSQKRGGGIYSQMPMTVTGSTISDNASMANGGGIFNDAGFTATLTKSTLSGNTATGNGGGIFNQGTAAMTNSTISGNSAGGSGGGFQNQGTATLNNVTIAANKAATGGGGISGSSSGTVSLSNTIVGTNSASTGGADCAGSINSLGHNLIGSSNGCTLSGNTAGNILNQDPRLDGLQDNGGPTETQELRAASFTTGTCSFGPCIQTLPPSPAIDAGSPATVGTGGGACDTVDQRGTARPIDGDGNGKVVCDIGAYEAPTGTTIGTFNAEPKDQSVAAGEHVPLAFSWTVPEGKGWRSLDDLQLILRDEQGTALWLRYHEVSGSDGTFGLIDPVVFQEGPDVAPGSPDALDAGAATLYPATSSVDGPPGQTVTLNLDFGFTPAAAGRTFDVLVLAVDDAEGYQGFSPAATITVAPDDAGG